MIGAIWASIWDEAIWDTAIWAQEGVEPSSGRRQKARINFRIGLGL